MEESLWAVVRSGESRSVQVESGDSVLITPASPFLLCRQPDMLVDLARQNGNIAEAFRCGKALSPRMYPICFNKHFAQWVTIRRLESNGQPLSNIPLTSTHFNLTGSLAVGDPHLLQ
ncbi:MAG: hypothetical protein Q9202_000483 [Teloschistes flavicans]